MTWRVDWNNQILGNTSRLADAQALATFDRHPFALATDTQTGERWILHAEGWAETVRASSAERERPLRRGSADPEKWPVLRQHRADIDD